MYKFFWPPPKLKQPNGWSHLCRLFNILLDYPWRNHQKLEALERFDVYASRIRYHDTENCIASCILAYCIFSTCPAWPSASMIQYRQILLPSPSLNIYFYRKTRLLFVSFLANLAGRTLYYPFTMHGAITSRTQHFSLSVTMIFRAKPGNWAIPFHHFVRCNL